MHFLGTFSFMLGVSEEQRNGGEEEFKKYFIILINTYLKKGIYYCCKGICNQQLIAVQRD